jgi:nucleoside-diphosphate-sugar epimerase
MQTSPRSQQIAIIGGSGFIGTELVRQLVAAGHRVRIGDIAPSKAHPRLREECDVRDLAQVISFIQGADVVYNLAAQHADDVRPASLYYEVNAGGARNLCEAAERLDIRRLYFTSSVSVYGFSRDKVDEDGPKRPFNDYGRSKLQAEEIMREWYAKQPGRTLVMVRPTVVFGPGNRGNVYHLMKFLARNPYVMIGQGRNVKAVSYVENVAAFLGWLLPVEAGEYIYNYADTEFPVSTLVRWVRQWVGRDTAPLIRLPYGLAYGIGLACDSISQLTGARLPIRSARVQKFCGPTQYSAARAMSLGFKPPADAQRALEATFRKEFSFTGMASEGERVSARG